MLNIRRRSYVVCRTHEGMTSEPHRMSTTVPLPAPLSLLSDGPLSSKRTTPGYPFLMIDHNNDHTQQQIRRQTSKSRTTSHVPSISSSIQILRPPNSPPAHPALAPETWEIRFSLLHRIAHPNTHLQVSCTSPASSIYRRKWRLQECGERSAYATASPRRVQSLYAHWPSIVCHPPRRRRAFSTALAFAHRGLISSDDRSDTLHTFLRHEEHKLVIDLL